ARVKNEPRHPLLSWHSEERAQASGGALARNTEWQFFHPLYSPAKALGRLNGECSGLLIERDRLAVEGIEREQPVRTLVSGESVAEINLADVDRRQGHVAGIDLCVVAMRSFASFAEHVVAGGPTPELAVYVPGESLR